MSAATLGLDGTVAWPQEIAAAYRAAGYWRDQTLADALRTWAARSGADLALVCGKRRWSYRELDARVDRLAAGLQTLGIQPGARVVVQLPNCAEWLVVFFALLRCGALPVLALPAQRLAEIGSFCAQSAAVAYIGAADAAGYDYRPLASALRACCPSLRSVILDGAQHPFIPLASVDAEPTSFAPASAAAVALFQLSGGSTGTPKLIPRTHNDYLYSVEASASVCQLSRASVYLCALPMAHNFPLSSPGALGTLAAGGCVVIAPQPSPTHTFGLIAQERVTITALVPPLARLWLEAAPSHQQQLASLDVLQVGGAPLDRTTAERITSVLGCRLQQVYGMAEGLVNYTRLDDPLERVWTTQGRPLSPADELRIVDAEDRDVAPGAPGQLLTRGPYTIRGYYRAAEHNRHAFTADGFYRTGDLVRMTADGYLVVVGRSKDQINRGGEKIAAAEVEQHLLAHPHIQAATLVAVPDQWLGERACAVIVTSVAGIDRPTIAAFLRSRGLADYKIPDVIRVVDALPTTPVGKIDKRQLRDQLTAAQAHSRRSR